MSKKTVYMILGVISTIYLINPTAGVFELLPDNFPVVGNLDEFAASALLIKAIKVVFGKNSKGENQDVLDSDLLKKG